MVMDSKYVGMLEKYILILERNIELEVLNRKLEETHTQMRADAKGLNKKVNELTKDLESSRITKAHVSIVDTKKIPVDECDLPREKKWACIGGHYQEIGD